jgi:ribosomal protein S18 acetylase RimI-like enzyme
MKSRKHLSRQTMGSEAEVDREAFAAWLERRGYRIIRTASSYWHQGGPLVYQAFPYHSLIDPSEGELRQLFTKYKAIGLRYSTPLSSSAGIISYHVVYTGEEYPLDALPQKARYDVRKGLKCADIQPVSLAMLGNEGWRARSDTLIRQGRTRAENSAWWRELCDSAEDLPGFEAWAAIADGEIVASLLAFTSDHCCSILYQQSVTERLRNGVNNALTYIFTKEVLRRSGVSQIFYGLHSLDAPASVDEYKFRMRYTAKPVRQCVVFHPWLAPFISRTSHRFVKRLLMMKPKEPSLAKIEGMIRFYIEGKRPLSEQVWPEVLKKFGPKLTESQKLLQNISPYLRFEIDTPQESTPLNSVQIEPVSASDDLDTIVSIHMLTFPGFFLTLMGPAVIRQYYRTVLEYKNSIFLRVRIDDKIVGFVCGFGRPKAFYSHFKSRQRYLIPKVFIRMFGKPYLLERVIVNWRRIGTAGGTDSEVELSSICVLPEFMGSGAARSLLQCFAHTAKERGFESIYLTTDALNNERANTFYAHQGFLFQGTTSQRQRAMNLFRLAL